MKVIRTLTVATLLASAASVAQAQATLPFRQGQWGIQADANGNSGALLRFVSPRTALVLSLEATRSSFDAKPGTNVAEGSSSNVGLALGMRQHRPLAAGLASTFEAGVGLYRYHSTMQFTAPIGEVDSRIRGVGPYVGFGAQYLVAQRLGVGIGYRLSATWGKSTSSDQNSSQRETTRNYSAGFTPVYATLYF